MWQAARLESAENCLFRQRKLTGNGNYTVGIRCQFGLKSSIYDSNIYFNDSNVPAKSRTPAGTPMIGGTVMQLAADCGTLEKTYLCVCKGVEFEK